MTKWKYTSIVMYVNFSHFFYFFWDKVVLINLNISKSFFVFQVKEEYGTYVSENLKNGKMGFGMPGKGGEFHDGEETATLCSM